MYTESTNCPPMNSTGKARRKPPSLRVAFNSRVELDRLRRAAKRHGRSMRYYILDHVMRAVEQDLNPPPAVLDLNSGGKSVNTG